MQRPRAPLLRLKEDQFPAHHASTQDARGIVFHTRRTLLAALKAATVLSLAKRDLQSWQLLT